MHFVAVLEIDRIAGTICIRTEIKFPTFICLEPIEAKTNLLTDKKTCSKTPQSNNTWKEIDKSIWLWT